MSVVFFRTNKMLLALYIVIVLLIEGMFLVFSENQNTKASQGIEVLLRNDINLNSYYQLARTLSDLENVGYLSCVKLENSGLNHLIPYDTQYKKGCDKTKLMMKTFKAVDGQNWKMQYQTQTGPWLFIAHFFGQLSVLIFFVLMWLSIKRKEELLNLKISEEQFKNSIAKQVSHDIRSPLSALTMVAGTLKDIPEDKRILIRNATQRINDIANDLLRKGQKSEDIEHTLFRQNSEYKEEPLSLTTYFVPAVIDVLVSEKRMQYREHVGLEIEVDLKNSFGAFAAINSKELKRVISNLINNSVEAFTNHEGRIIVGIRLSNSIGTEKVEIFVKDNGKGIPRHILAKLGQSGITAGKEDTQSGSGLGIYHAKKTIESFGGQLKIESTEGQGTAITIILPLAEAPPWFANKLDLSDKKYLVSLDDDISIHQIWAGRLQSLGITEVEHIKFQSGEFFEQYVNSNILKLKHTLFLIDFELLNQGKTGLDVIEDLGIEKYSILVTSRYEETDIQTRSSRLKLPLLPKSLAGFVPVHAALKDKHDMLLVDDDPLVNQSNIINTAKVNDFNVKVLYDLCLIDDDTQLVHSVWGFVAASKSLNIKMFSTPEEFISVVGMIDRRTPIYVDVSLGSGINGIDAAEEIYKLGFVEINLATGFNPDSLVVPPFIRRVVSKDFPEMS
ncbi:MAG: sensor histidine kinase [Bdellovibrio sp.]